MIGSTSNTLWQSRGEVEHIPPDCLPGEGAVSMLATSGDPLPIQHVTRFHALPTLGEAHKQTFDIECTVLETGHSERGIGASRRAGEQAAAAAMVWKATVWFTSATKTLAS